MKALALGMVVTLAVAGCGLRTGLRSGVRPGDGGTDLRARDDGSRLSLDALGALSDGNADLLVGRDRDGSIAPPMRDASAADRPSDERRPPPDVSSPGRDAALVREAAVISDRFVERDAAVVAPDASATPDAAATDRMAAPDLRSDRPSPLLEFRQTLPLSTSVVTSRRPTFAWTDPGNIDFFILEICRDRQCNNVIGYYPTGPISYTLASLLDEGPVFWRVTGRLQSGLDIVTDVWEIFVGNRTSPHDTSMLAVPDYNRDGYPDVAQAAVNGPGSVTTFGPGHVPIGAPFPLSGPARSLAYAVDVNGDGYGDLLLGRSGAVDVFQGSDAGLVHASTIAGAAGFAATVAGVGDVDGDGYGDVLVGTDDGGAGKASLYRGGRDGLRAIPSGAALPLGRLGAAGDVDADGFADVVACSPVGSKANLYAGGPKGLTLVGALADPRLGTGLPYGHVCQGVGDVNGDGFGDVVVIGGGTNLSAVLFYGSAKRISGAITVLQLGPAMGQSADGTFVASAGDLNRDGYGDVVIANATGLRIFLGAQSGLPEMPNVDLPGDFSTAAGAGDISGDHFGDLLVAPRDCTLPVQIYGGSAGGLDITELYSFPDAKALCPRHLLAR